MGVDVIGETIGSYRIIRQLGAGAMGQVYLAEHRHLKRQAALKLLSRELCDRPELLERFFLEARATSAIAHPGIVQIFDCEIDPTGRPYIVMEYLDGETLAGRLTRERVLAPLSVARLGRSIAEALDAAHAKQIVHRDLKPDNMFVRNDPPDTVKLVDFGIAKLTGDFKAAQVHQTRTGAMMGTPLYMSPEQCRDSASIDFRTDLYSLGCLMHEMLTGRPPFLRDNLGDLIVAHLTEPPPDPRALVPAVPETLAALTMALLRKDPRTRPASMRDVATQLMTFVARMTTVGGPETTAEPAPAAAPPVVIKTTFGDSAAEMVVDVPSTDDDLPPRSRRPLLIGVLLAVVAAGGVAVVLGTRSSSGDGATTTATTTTPVVGTTTTAATTPTSAATHAATSAPPAAEHHAGATPPPHHPTPDKKELAAAAATAAGNKKAKPGGKHGTEPAPVEAKPVPAAPPAGAGTTSLVATPEAARPAKEPPAAVDLSGPWEGPWTDAAKQQGGRLFVEVSGGTAVSGWLSNSGAQQSFRMAGTINAKGELHLNCECPEGQEFSARGTLHVGSDELKGHLTMSTSAGPFGRSDVVLHRGSGQR